MFVGHVSGVADEGDEPKDRLRDMTGHDLERRRDIHAEPSDDIAVFIAGEGPFPGIVRHQQRDHENQNIFIGLEPLKSLF